MGQQGPKMGVCVARFQAGRAKVVFVVACTEIHGNNPDLNAGMLAYCLVLQRFDVTNGVVHLLCEGVVMLLTCAV